MGGRLRGEKLCFLILFTFVAGSHFLNSEATEWFNEKFSHKPSTLSADQLKKICNETWQPCFKRLLNPILINRVPGTENHKFVKEYMKKQMKDLGWTIETDAFEDTTPMGVKPFENIIATLNPNTPRRLVLACHYDSKLFDDPVNFVGATDSAVPCTQLIHLAHVLKFPLKAHSSNLEANTTLQFLFFDGEEAFVEWFGNDNTYGSRHLAALWENTPYPTGTSTNMLQRMDMLILLDLLGSASPSFSNYFPSTASWYKILVETERTLRQTGGMWKGSTSSSAYFRDSAGHGGIADDHLPFVARNVDIVHLIASPFPAMWHTERDNMGALDFDTIDNLNQIFRVFVCRYLHLKI